MSKINIRIANPADAAALLKVYAPYVEKTAISFEYQVPSLEEFRQRIERTLKNYPYLVAEQDGEILGYAYTGPFVGRPAYAWAAETSIYLRQDSCKKGIGKALYQRLEEISRAQNIHNLYACIGWPDQEDEYLNMNSAQFHAHLGYRHVGEFRKCGYKFGRWYNMIWMEKLLLAHDTALPIIPFSELGEEYKNEIITL